MENNRCYGCMREKQQHPVCEFCGFDERTQNDVHQLPTGTILRGQYLIGRVLGQGGFGITYLGWDMYLDMPVAIKEFYPSSCVTRDTSVTMCITSFAGEASLAYESNKKRFMREGQALAKFKTLKNIVRIYDLFPENNTVYLVMEYAKGDTLQHYLRKNGPMQLDELLKILTPIMEDLQKVHEAGIIHRDISPDNIMLLDAGGAKLLDFGAVRQVDNPDQEKQLSKSTQAILKEGFAPAEQYNSRGSLGPWTDVYAMCATICYSLSGKLPMAAPDRAIDDNPDLFLDDLPITESSKEVIRRGMALKPKERTDSMEELLRQFREPADKIILNLRKNESVKPESQSQAGKRKWSVKKQIFAAAGAVLLVILAAVPVFILKKQSPKLPEKPYVIAENSPKLELKLGEVLQIDESFFPPDTDLENITFSSSDPDTVQIDENGLVTAKMYGTAYVYAQSLLDPTFRTQWSVVVSNQNEGNVQDLPSTTEPSLTVPSENPTQDSISDSHTEPGSTDPNYIDSRPTETKPAETKPAETKPAETKPTETKPMEPKPTEPKPTEATYPEDENGDNDALDGSIALEDPEPTETTESQPTCPEPPPVDQEDDNIDDYISKPTEPSPPETSEIVDTEPGHDASDGGAELEMP